MRTEKNKLWWERNKDWYNKRRREQYRKSSQSLERVEVLRKQRVYDLSKRYAKYGLSIEEADKMKQKGCEICGERKYRKLCIDHDHKTMKARGCLCSHCNTILGGLGDSENSERFEKVLRYLRKYENSCD